MAAMKRSTGSNSGRKRTRGTNDNDKPSRKEKTKLPDPNRHMWMGCGVLVVAIVVGWLWNQYFDNVDPQVRTFWSTLCQHASATCAPFVVPTKRTLQAARPIRAGEVLVEIPRAVQIWDLDALRDDFIRTELMVPATKHPRTNNPLPASAFLSAYLALQLGKLKSEEGAESTLDPIRRSYLEMLPNATELAYHPITWPREELMESLGENSLNQNVILLYQDMVSLEYWALSSASAKFKSLVTAEEYTTARILVLSRSFSPGPDAITTQDVSEEELLLFRETLGENFDFSKGCNVLVPILDMLNHHPQPNVIYSYSKEKQAFVISAKEGVPASWELMDSYGWFSDNHLFGRYGFVNGDGSGLLQASIALFHRNLDLGISSEFSYLPLYDQTPLPAMLHVQGKNIIRYLQYDDGYEECINGAEEADSSAFELKKLKLLHLLEITNNEKSWVINFPAREPGAKPTESIDVPFSDSPPEIDPRRLRINVLDILATCRLMTVIESDYNNTAMEKLQQNLGNETFSLEIGNESLEYRSFMCLARLAGSSHAMRKIGVDAQMQITTELHKNHFQSRNWTLAQLRLGEVQALQTVIGISTQYASQFEGNIPTPVTPEYVIRRQLCPAELSDKLFDVLPPAGNTE